jgi:hypothetical protein
VSTIFVLLFFAAVVGIFKPYIKGTKRSYFIGAAVLAFVLVGVTAEPSTQAADTKVAASGTGNAEAVEANSTSVEAASAAKPSKWTYSDDTDEMRGTKSSYASLDSENEVDLDFPYGEQRGQLMLRKRPEDGLNVMFQVGNGQILCHSFTESHVSIKFDDGPVQRYRCTDASDGSNNVAFLSNERSVVERLKKSKRAIVEAEFFQKGRQQFMFETAGLNWQ